MSTDWMGSALCAEVGGDMFLLEKGGSTVAPKRICQACPVIAECLNHALTNDIREGIWGGTSPLERRALRRAAA